MKWKSIAISALAIASTGCAIGGALAAGGAINNLFDRLMTPVELQGFRFGIFALLLAFFLFSVNLHIIKTKEKS